MADSNVYIVYLPPTPQSLAVSPTGDLLVLYAPPNATLVALVKATGGSITVVPLASFSPPTKPPVITATPTNSPQQPQPVTVTTPVQASIPAPASAVSLLIQLVNSSNNSISINYTFTPVKITGGAGVHEIYCGYDKLL